MTTTFASETLATARRRAGLSQRALCRKSGVAQSTISSIEHGKLQPGLPVLDRLVRSCGAELVVSSRSLDGRWSAKDAALAARGWIDQGDEDSALRCGIQLRDDLRKASPERVIELMSEEPSATGLDKLDSMLAAVVEEACLANNLPSPDWATPPNRVLSEPTELWWLLPKARGRALSMTPPTFFSHGLIVSERDLASA